MFRIAEINQNGKRSPFVDGSCGPSGSRTRDFWNENPASWATRRWDQYDNFTLKSAPKQRLEVQWQHEGCISVSCCWADVDRWWFGWVSALRRYQIVFDRIVIRSKKSWVSVR